MKKKILSIFLLVFCLTIQPVIATPGALDTGFGTGGLVTTDFSGDYDYGFSMAIQSDGKIIVAGLTFNSTDIDFALARYTADGDLDTEFGTGGLVTTDFSGNYDGGSTVVIQPDGKIIVAGFSSNGADEDFALARYTADGNLDTEFGTGGLVTTDFSGNDDYGYAVAIQPDGKIIVAGGDAEGSVIGLFNDFTLARYTADGQLDTEFGTGGLVTTDFSNNDDCGHSVAIQADGKIIVAGYSSSDFALARYTADGQLDTGFGTGGLVTTDFSGNDDYGYAVAIQPDGKIIVAGTKGVVPSYILSANDTGLTSDFALARYTADGQLDTGFGTGGLVITDFNGNDCITSIAIHPDGKIIVAGGASNGTDMDFALARYTADGVIDMGSIVTTDFSGDYDCGHSVVIQSDGKIIVAGITFSGTDMDFALARYQYTNQTNGDDDSGDSGGCFINSLGN